MVRKTEAGYDMELKSTAELPPEMLWWQYILCILTFSHQEALWSTDYDLCQAQTT